MSHISLFPQLKKCNNLHGDKQGAKIPDSLLGKSFSSTLVFLYREVQIDGGIEPEIAARRSQDGMIEIQGALILFRILDDTAPFDRVIQNLPTKLLG